MKSLRIFLIYVVACESYMLQYRPRNSITQSAVQSLNNDMCRGRMDGTLFPDDQNCHMFIECQGQNPVRRVCQSSTLFNTELFFCFPAHTVNCGRRQKPNAVNNLGSNQVPQTLEEHHKMCRNQPNGAIFENAQNCRAFIECRENFRLDRECEIGKLFEASSKSCLSDFAVNCRERPIISDNAFLDFSVICTRVSNGQSVPHPNECDMFFECNNKNAIMKKCPPQTLFETSSNMCIDDFIVNCGNRKRPISSVQKQQQPIPNFATVCENLPTGTRISNPDNCQSYFECRNGQRMEFSCPLSMSFDVITNQCIENSLVNCVQRNGQQNEICQGQRDGQRYLNPLDCSDYFECQNGARTDKKCPSGQLYNHQIGSCAASETVSCGSRRLPQVPNSQNGVQMPCERPGVYIRAHPLPCQSTYFICIDHNMIQHSCANGIIFNPETLQCDFAQNSGCVTRSPQIPRTIDCTNQAFSPHLTVCNQYYICVNGMPQLMRCPHGKIWDNNKARCDLITPNTQCNGRIE